MLRIEIEREADGRFIAEVPELPGVMAYGRSREQAVANVEALALRTLADRLENGEPVRKLTESHAPAASHTIRCPAGAWLRSRERLGYM